MGKQVRDTSRMYKAIQKVDIQPIINEIHHNPLWIFALIALFVVLGNLFEVLWMIVRDLKNCTLKILRIPRRFVKKYIEKVKHFFSNRYGKKKREKKHFFKK